MGRRSRKARRVAGATTGEGPGQAGAVDAAVRSASPANAPSTVGSASPGNAPSAGTPSRRERSAARDEAIRAGLEPIGPGDRPLPVTIAAALAAFIALANLGAYAAGFEVRGQRPALGGILALTVLMAACAYGLWRTRYWGVLGFELLLGLTVVYAAVSLTVAANLVAVALCLATILGAGWLFWKLVRVMARIQMPTRPSSGT